MPGVPSPLLFSTVCLRVSSCDPPGQPRLLSAPFGSFTPGFLPGVQTRHVVCVLVSPRFPVPPSPLGGFHFGSVCPQPVLSQEPGSKCPSFPPSPWDFLVTDSVKPAFTTLSPPRGPPTLRVLGSLRAPGLAFCLLSLPSLLDPRAPLWGCLPSAQSPSFHLRARICVHISTCVCVPCVPADVSSALALRLSCGSGRGQVLEIQLQALLGRGGPCRTGMVLGHQEGIHSPPQAQDLGTPATGPMAPARRGASQLQVREPL